MLSVITYNTYKVESNFRTRIFQIDKHHENIIEYNQNMYDMIWGRRIKISCSKLNILKYEWFIHATPALFYFVDIGSCYIVDFLLVSHRRGYSVHIVLGTSTSSNLPFPFKYNKRRSTVCNSYYRSIKMIPNGN